MIVLQETDVEKSTRSDKMAVDVRKSISYLRFTHLNL
jgi:hypothetical protein